MLSALIAAAALTLTVQDPGTAVTLRTEVGPLHGTWLAPADAPRAVGVIIAGSGPTDRDGNSAQGIRASTYRLLAEGLADQGIATVRYDKRGVGESLFTGMAEQDLRFSHLVDDAIGWAEQAAEQAGLPCAWLIGHSEGALVALAATERDTSAICGLVLVAGAGRPARIVLEEQLGPQLPEPMRTRAFAALAELEAGHEVESVPGLEALFRPSVQPYLISWLALDPRELVTAYDGPVLVAQGTTDIQVTTVDSDAMKAAQPDATLVVWEGVNHVLKVAPAERAANIRAYADPDLPLAAPVVPDIAGFILAPR